MEKQTIQRVIETPDVLPKCVWNLTEQDNHVKQEYASKRVMKMVKKKDYKQRFDDIRREVETHKDHFHINIFDEGNFITY